MDTLLLSGVDEKQRKLLDRNPEAIFDILTMNSHKDSHHRNEAFTAHVFQDGFRQNEAEFEAFVEQFPIDDSISECFALATEPSESKSTVPKFVTGAKRPQVSKYSKLKKKLGWGTSEETLHNMADDSLSRETKRSKKGGGVESKRHKWRTPKEKSVNFAEISEFDTVSEFPIPVDVHAPQSRDREFVDSAPPIVSISVSGSSTKSNNSTASGHMTGSDDVFHPGTSVNHVTVHEGPSTPCVPPKTYGDRVPDYVNVGSVRKDDCFSSILVQDPVMMMKNLEELPADVAITTRDERGNTVLHRCVELGNPDAVYMILDKFPGLTSDMNTDNMTAIELAVKVGQVGCLKVMLERNQRHKTLGTPLLIRLLHISGSYGQYECLRLLLSYLPRDQPGSTCLPGDARGNTAAHVSAKTGHVECLQALVSSGYDVTSENLIHQRPLHVAHQNSRHVCFGYLMLLDVCEKLLNDIIFQASVNTSLRQQTTGIKSSIEQLKSYLNRYQTLLTEARESLVENRESILESLVLIHEDLIQVTDSTAENGSVDKQNEIRDKLDELAGEIERLEDTFEFSPLEDIDTVMSRVAQSLDESLSDVTESAELDPQSGITEEQLKISLCKLLRDVHEDAAAENWNVKQRVDEIVRELVKSTSKIGINTRRSNQDQDRAELRLSLDKLNTSNSSASQTSKQSERARSSRGRQKSNGVYNEIENKVKSDNEKENQNVSNYEVATVERELTHQRVGNLENKVVTEPILQGRTEHVENETKSKTKTSWANLGTATKKSDQKIVGPSTSSDKSGDQTIKKSSSLKMHHPLKEEESCGITDKKCVTQDEKEKIDIKTLSLDERMDLLIAGERARERLEDAEISFTDNVQFIKPGDSVHRTETKASTLSPKGTASICTTTSFTSITSDSSDFSAEFQLEIEREKKRRTKPTSYVVSDFKRDIEREKQQRDKISSNSSSTNSATSNTNLVPLTMIDSADSVTSIDMFTLTSDSTSYWWDVEDENDEIAPSNRGHIKSDRLNQIEEEHISNEEIRRQRVIQHIKALQRTRFPSDEYTEKITTATGETMGGFEAGPNNSREYGKAERDDKRIVVDVHSALKTRQEFKPIPMPRSSKRPQVPDSEDSEDTVSLTGNVLHRYFGADDQEISSLDAQWEDMYMSEDEATINGKPWYEMSSDDDVSLVPSWRSDDDTEGSRTPRMI